MRLAMSQIAWLPGQDREAYTVLQQSGLHGLEIAPTRVAGDTPYAHPAKAEEFAREIKAEFGLAVCSMQSIWYGQSGSMFGPERAHLLAYTRQAVLFAQRAGAGNLVFGNPKARVLPQGMDDRSAAEFFSETGNFAAQHGTVLALEANPPLYGTNFMNTTPQAFDMARRVNSPGCKVNLDFGTMIINGEEVSGLAGRVAEINHVHISEPELAMIQPRQGHSLLAQLLRSEGYSGYISVEMKQQPMENIKRAAAYLAEVFR